MVPKQADKAVGPATQGPPLLGALIPHLDLSEFKSHYTERDEEGAVNGDSLILTLFYMEDQHSCLILLPEAHIPSSNIYTKGPIMKGML